MKTPRVFAAPATLPDRGSQLDFPTYKKDGEATMQSLRAALLAAGVVFVAVPGASAAELAKWGPVIKASGAKGGN